MLRLSFPQRIRQRDLLMIIPRRAENPAKNADIGRNRFLRNTEKTLTLRDGIL